MYLEKIYSIIFAKAETITHLAQTTGSKKKQKNASQPKTCVPFNNTMVKHSKHNVNRPFFTHVERARLNNEGYGTQKLRLGTDSMLPFDACALCLKRCVQPVATPYGYFYCRECILENILAQKKEQKKLEQLQQSEQQHEAAQTKQAAHDKLKNKIEQFEKITDTAPATNSSNSKTEASFWMPTVSNANHHKDKESTKTVKKIVDPSCNKSLRVKDLITVSFSIPKHEKKQQETSSQTCNYECPSCFKVFTQAMKGYVIRTCGHTLCKHCFEQYMKNAQQCACVVCSQKTKERDFILVQNSGTGFAGSNKEKVEAKSYKPMLGVM